MIFNKLFKIQNYNSVMAKTKLNKLIKNKLKILKIKIQEISMYFGPRYKFTYKILRI